MSHKQWAVALLLVLGTISGVLVYGGTNGSDDRLADEHGIGEFITSLSGIGDEEKPEDTAPFEFRQADVGLNITYSGSDGGGETDITPDGMEMVTNAGVYVTDYNRDGWSDILTVGTVATESVNGSNPVLFENMGGEFKSPNALPTHLPPMKSALFFDYDGDGWDDLLLLPVDNEPILLENTNGEYIRHDAGFEESLAVPTGATTADFNDDGCPDIFVIQNGNWNDNRPIGIRNYSAQGIDNGNPNYLYLGECDGDSVFFSRASDAGIGGNRWSLAVSAGDLNNDGLPDVHVANDYNHDILYMSNGEGTFEQVRLPERTNQNGMSSELADVNGDRLLDIFVTNIYLPDELARSINKKLVFKNDGNNLLINQGDGKFADRGREQDVQKGGWGWAAAISDFDNDGDEDLIHATREIRFGPLAAGNLKPERREQINDWPMYSHPIVRERHNGTYHKIAASEVGFQASDSRGLVRLDYDRDGDIDLVFATKSQFRVYENTGTTGNALQVRVEDETGSTALGSEVFVSAESEDLSDEGRAQWRTVRPYTDFLSQDERIAHFGVGSATEVSLKVVRPNGTTQSFEDVPTNQRLVIGPDGITQTVALDGATE